MKRIILASGIEETGTLVEVTLVRSQDAPVVADRDVDAKVVKTAYMTHEAPAYLDFVTTIRMPRGWQFGVVVENQDSADPAVTQSSLLSLFREL